jgi:hypothetical protein
VVERLIKEKREALRRTYFMYKQGAKTRPIWDAPEHVIFQLRLTRVAVYKRREKTPG